MKSKSEMNQHEKKALFITKECYCDIVGGAENAVLDKSDGWENWQRLLDDREAIKAAVYDEVMQTVQGKDAQHIKFAGTQFICDIIESRLVKDGY